MSIVAKIQSQVLILIVGLFLITADAQAGWFDNFAKSVVSNPSSSWTLQQQSHYAGGGFSVRYDNNSHSFFNITAPKISIGCGGIDAFWGGFSFLNPEYFVQMFRNILAAAPAFAFQLALSSLCPQCMDVLNTLNELANLMNSMAMDECGAAQALGYAGGAAIAGIFDWKSESSKTDGGGSDWLESLKGYADDAKNFIKDLRERLEDKFCGFLKGAALDYCKKVYTTSGTLWERAVELDRMKHMKGERTLDDTYVSIIRAIVGDVEFVLGNDVKTDENEAQSGPAIPKIPPIKPCEGFDASDLLDAMLKAEKDVSMKIKVIPVGSKACADGELPESLKVTVLANAAILDIKAKIFHLNNPLDAKTITIVKENALPIYKMINLFALRLTTKGGEFMSTTEIKLMEQLMAIGHAAYIINTSLQRAASVMAYIAAELGPAAFEAGAIVNEIDNSKTTIIERIALMSGIFNAKLGSLEKDFQTVVAAITTTTAMFVDSQKTLVNAILDKAY